jgi:hypothetical protein
MPRRRNRLYFSCKRYRAHDGQIRPFTPVNPIVTFPPKFVPIGSPSHLGSLSLLGHLEHASFSNLAGGHLSSRVIPLLRPLKARPPLSLSRAPGPARSGPRLLGLQFGRHVTLCSQKQVFETPLPLGSSCSPANVRRPSGSSAPGGATATQEGSACRHRLLSLLPERGSEREWLTPRLSRPRFLLAALTDVTGRTPAAAGSLCCARAQAERAERRGRWPVASPTSAILLLWLLGTS